MTTRRDEYTAKMKHELDALNARIDGLQFKAHEAREDAREAYQEKVKAARQQSALATAKLAEMREASTDSWDHMVGEMDKLRDAFKHSFNYFKSQI